MPITRRRPLLVEAAWQYRARPRVGATLSARQQGQPRARDREQRAKRRTIIAIAAARELAGFCWPITTRTE